MFSRINNFVNLTHKYSITPTQAPTQAHKPLLTTLPSTYTTADTVVTDLLWHF